VVVGHITLELCDSSHASAEFTEFERHQPELVRNRTTAVSALLRTTQQRYIASSMLRKYLHLWPIFWTLDIISNRSNRAAAALAPNSDAIVSNHSSDVSVSITLRGFRGHGVYGLRSAQH